METDIQFDEACGLIGQQKIGCGLFECVATAPAFAEESRQWQMRYTSTQCRQIGNHPGGAVVGQNRCNPGLVLLKLLRQLLDGQAQGGGSQCPARFGQHDLFVRHCCQGGEQSLRHAAVPAVGSIVPAPRGCGQPRPPASCCNSCPSRLPPHPAAPDRRQPGPAAAVRALQRCRSIPVAVNTTHSKPRRSRCSASARIMRAPPPGVAAARLRLRQCAHVQPGVPQAARCGLPPLHQDRFPETTGRWPHCASRRLPQCARNICSSNIRSVAKLLTLAA